MKVGFIGLGNLGKALVGRLVSEGVNLTVWNRTREKASGLDLPIADSPAALIGMVDVLFLNLFDSKAVGSVLTGDEGILKAGCRGKIIIDTTTNHFSSVGSFHELLAGAGASYLEAPVLGSVVPASKGLLTILVSGKRPAYEEALPYLEKIGKDIFYLEEPALATKMKLINNLVLGSFMATLAEAIVLGEKTGIDKETVIDILSSGAGNSLVLNAKREKIINEDFSTHFSSSLIYKDLHYLQDLVRTLKSPAFTASVTKELFAMTLLRGMEDLDFSAIYRVLKD